jgi:hypothetical protein
VTSSRSRLTVNPCGVSRDAAPLRLPPQQVTKAVLTPELSGGAREGMAMPLPRHDLPDHSTKVQVKPFFQRTVYRAVRNEDVTRY